MLCRHFCGVVLYFYSVFGVLLSWEHGRKLYKHWPALRMIS